MTTNVTLKMFATKAATIVFKEVSSWYDETGKARLDSPSFDGKTYVATKTLRLAEAELNTAPEVYAEVEAELRRIAKSIYGKEIEALLYYQTLNLFEIIARR